MQKSDKPPTRKPRPKKKKDEPPEEPKATIFTTNYLSTFLLLISTLLIYDVIVINNRIHDSINFGALKTELVQSVHGQTQALTIVLNKLDDLHDGVNVVNFIGSTGVGKTFIANILKRHFHPFSYEKIEQMSDSKYNLIVFDDLTIKDVDRVLSLIKTIPQDVVSVVICIFNIQETDGVLNHKINYKHVDVIQNKFNKSEVPHDDAKFAEFSSEDVKNWIAKQLVERGVNKEKYAEITKLVLEGHDFKFHGLKGLSSKLNLEL